MKNSIFLILLFFSLKLYSQVKNVNLDSVFTIVEIKPEFKGGQKELLAFLSKNIKYPLYARENQIEGIVYVSFVVKTDGLIERVTIMDSKIFQTIYDEKKKEWVKKDIKSDGSLFRESIRIILSMPKWRPGLSGGKAVNSIFTLPISFKLS